MSKSDMNSNNVIFLLEKPNVILKKIKKSITDSNKPHTIHYDPIFKPGISNLLSVLSGITNKKIFDLEKEFKNKTYDYLKNIIAEELIKVLTPIQSKYNSIRRDVDYLNKIITEGSEKARYRATSNLNRIYNLIGLFI